MIKFNYNKSKTLKFAINEIDNISIDTLKVNAKIQMEGFDCSFNGKIVNEFIVIEIPALKDVINEDRLKEETEIVIEAISNDTYLVSYSDTINIIRPAKLETKIGEVVEDDEKVDTRLNINLEEDSDSKLEKSNDNLNPQIEKKTIKEMFDAS